MTSTIEIMSESEVARGRDEEAGFGTLRTEHGALPLLAMRVDAKIDGLVAQVTEFRDSVADYRREDYRGHASALYARLIDPIDNCLTASRLTIVLPHTGENDHACPHDTPRAVACRPENEAGSGPFG